MVMPVEKPLEIMPSDVIKHRKHALLLHLHQLLCLCVKEGAVPQDMCDAKIVTLHKNKGDRSDCNNYHGISLLSVVGNVFACVALGILQIFAERIYPESQCGFRTGRSTIDFIDLTKAFDLVTRSALFKLLEKIDCSPKLLSVIFNYDGII